MIDIILASKASIRKEMLKEANIPFEVIVSNVDESANPNHSFGDQLMQISMKKAYDVFEKTEARSKRIIVAADQNIVFNGKMYGKPASIEEARKLLKEMMGSNQIFSYVGNAIIYADGDKILDIISNYKTARMGLDVLSAEILEDYLTNGNPLGKCGGINIRETPSLHLLEGKLSTASGMTTECLTDLLSTLD